MIFSQRKNSVFDRSSYTECDLSWIEKPKKRTRRIVIEMPRVVSYARTYKRHIYYFI